MTPSEQVRHSYSSSTFHPFELAVCGFSGSGKTTLVKRLVTRLGGRYKIAYFKHGCHRFDIDRKGKDSEVIKAAGAHTVIISDPLKHAFIADGVPAQLWTRTIVEQSDILLVEGLKELPLPKLLMIDQECSMLELLDRGGISNVQLIVTPDEDSKARAERCGVPVLDRDDTDGILDFIEHYYQAITPPLYGLVLAGGRSSRMGHDKALIDYHGQKQLFHTASLLDSVCRKTWISCREEQVATYAVYGRECIPDAYTGFGPIAALLSAQQAEPDAAWLILACDIPLMTGELIGDLARRRHPMAPATAFRHRESGKVEPLAAIYEPKSRPALLLRHAFGNNSLASYLQDMATGLVELEDAAQLRNVNNPRERLDAERLLSQQAQGPLL